MLIKLMSKMKNICFDIFFYFSCFFIFFMALQISQEFYLLYNCFFTDNCFTKNKIEV